MARAGNVCCVIETVECHGWLESECACLAERYIDIGLKGTDDVSYGPMKS